MGSATTSHDDRIAQHEGSDLEWLRSPGERTAFLLVALLNFAVIGVAIAIVLAGTSWLGTHPSIARHVDEIRLIVFAAMLALPAASFARNIGYDVAVHGGVRVSEHQFTRLYVEYVKACRKLGFEHVPDLYLSLDVQGYAAVAHTRLNGQSVIVLNADFIDDDWAEGLDFLSFAVAGALGAIRMGHTRWWVEVLTVYTRTIPGLRTPILVEWTFTRDRCAAYAVRDGIRGLLLEAVGKHALSSVDVPSFIDQTERPIGLLDTLANVRRKGPSLVARARMLYEHRFFERARDRERWGAMTR